MKPAEKLAESLDVLKGLQKHGQYAIQSKALSRTHRERLLKNGFLEEILKGWYIPIRPDEKQGESTAWYASFWNFCASYLSKRFGTEWILSPEQSLLLHAENWTVPRQLLVRTPKGTNRKLELPHDTSLFQARLTLPVSQGIEIKNGLRLYTPALALIYCSSRFFSQYPTESRAMLLMFDESSALLHYLLAEGHSKIAGRVCGALKNVGRVEIANDIKQTMVSAGYQIREEDPFVTTVPIDFSTTNKAPHRRRLEMMWYEMRQPITDIFPMPSDKVFNKKAYLHSVQESYTNDAYHSLSIEGYQVSPELIEKIRSGQWNPEAFLDDKKYRNALAARGYWQAFKRVESSLEKVLNGDDLGTMIQNDHGGWYRELFQPSVVAGILKPSDLAGYRQSPVFIRQSKHIPPRSQVVCDLMEEFFQRITEESDPAVRVILGHFFFVYIHPYPDGNGRIGRFLMNLMLAAGQYPWTIVPIDRRGEYMDALEHASVQQDIIPFTRFVASCLGSDTHLASHGD